MEKNFSEMKEELDYIFGQQPYTRGEMRIRLWPVAAKQNLIRHVWLGKAGFLQRLSDAWLRGTKIIGSVKESSCYTGQLTQGSSLENALSAEEELRG